MQGMSCKIKKFRKMANNYGNQPLRQLNFSSLQHNAHVEMHKFRANLSRSPNLL